MISGHITICKIYKDGTKEVVLDKSNIVTKGLGSSFIDILQNAGSTETSDYRPKYFQIGTNNMGYDTQSTGTDTSAYFYQLSAPLLWSAYGEDTDLFVEQKNRGFYASTINPGELTGFESGSVTGTELVFSSAPLSSAMFSSIENSSSWFAEIPSKNITRWFINSCECEIILDEETANDNTISEIGLYAKNPKGFGSITPLLMAYKKFTGIPKSSTFSLAFYWDIGFAVATSAIDRNYTGGSDDRLAVPHGYLTFFSNRPTDITSPPTFSVAPQDVEIEGPVIGEGVQEGDVVGPGVPDLPTPPVPPTPTTPTEPGDY